MSSEDSRQRSPTQVHGHRPAGEPITVTAAYDGDPARVAEARAVTRAFVSETWLTFGLPASPDTQQRRNWSANCSPMPAAMHPAAAFSP